MRNNSLIKAGILFLVIVGVVSFWVSGCGSSSSSSTTTDSCTLDDNTTQGAASSNGCYLLTRDTTSCQATREAQGLSGFWLKFSCRVTLTKSGSNVVITTDGQPDYKSAYFATTNACYASGFPSGRSANPNTLGSQSISMTIPLSPSNPSDTTGSAMSLGVVGVALNGVVIYSNVAAPGDNIYNEVSTFDKCEGHPAGTMYHYHTEPTTASNSDANFIGVMRDGYPIYGRYHTGTTAPTLTHGGTTTKGGHTGTTVDSSSSVYHYHVNLQTSGSSSAYFITSGYYMGPSGQVGSCTGCN